jgi:uncharacterized membrane protein YdjX (TVP38/TMEM64 family)
MEITPSSKPHPRLQLLGKAMTTLLLFALLLAALYFLFETKSGATLCHDPRNFGNDVHRFVHRHKITAPLAYLGLYTIFAVLALPIWWLQILAGIGFGLYEGTFVSLLGSTFATGIAVALSRWIAGDYFHKRIESRMEQLKQLDEKLGHNGFLFVMTVRLIPLLPFGLFNYALGLSNVSFLDSILGTFLGAMPVIALHVSVGAGYHPWDNWKFDLILTSMTTLLLLPLILRYVRPQWFKKIGVE